MGKKPDYTEWLEEQIEPMLGEWVCDLFAWAGSDYCETHCTSEGVTIKCLRAAFEEDKKFCAVSEYGLHLVLGGLTMSDLISRQAALDIIDAELNGWLTEDERLHLEGVGTGIECLPTIDEIYGFKMDHLATIAKLMEKEGVGPEEAVTLLQDADRVARVIVNELINEQNDMIKRTMEEWKNGGKKGGDEDGDIT